MGLYTDLGIQDDMSDAQLATHLSQQRAVWNGKRTSADTRERLNAEQMVRKIDVLSGAEARIGNFSKPSLIMKTLCAAIDGRCAGYRELEDTLLRACSSGVYNEDFQSVVLGYLESTSNTDLAEEWNGIMASRRAPSSRSGKGRPSMRSSGARSAERKRTQAASSQGEDGTVRRKKKPTWKRKLRRLYRKAKRLLRRIPRQMLIIIVGVIALIIILSVIASSVIKSNKAKKAAQAVVEVEETIAEEDVTEEEEEATEETAVLDQLKGMESYSLVTDETEVDTLVSSLSQAQPSTCTASSVLVGLSGSTYDTDYLFDDDLTTSWQEGEDDEGIGVTITSAFSSQMDIQGIALWIGNQNDQDRYDANNRPQQITISVSCSGQSYSKSYTLSDTMGGQVILFDSAVPMESVVIRIDSVYSGSYYDDTVISELKFLY